MEENILKKVPDVVDERSVRFEIDVRKKGKIKKKSFEIRPLTLSQLHRISKLILDIDIKDTASGVFELIKNHSTTCAEIIAIAVTDSKKKPSKKLVNLLFNNLDHRDMDTAITIVAQQMDILPFMSTMASIKTLSVLERKVAGVKSVERNVEDPAQKVPGNLSEAS